MCVSVMIVRSYTFVLEYKDLILHNLKHVRIGDF
jgi:hypothetical protein